LNEPTYLPNTRQNTWTFFNIFFLQFYEKYIIGFNIGRNSYEPSFETAVGLLPPFEMALATYHRLKRRRPLSVADPLRPRRSSRRGKGRRGVESLDSRLAQGSGTCRRQGSSRQGRGRPPPVPEPQDGSKPAGRGWTCHTRAPQRNESWGERRPSFVFSVTGATSNGGQKIPTWPAGQAPTATTDGGRRAVDSPLGTYRQSKWRYVLPRDQKAVGLHLYKGRSPCRRRLPPLLFFSSSWPSSVSTRYVSNTFLVYLV
jgi:hypothetical protein